MKKKKRIIAIIVFGVILPILTLIIMLTYEFKYTASLKREYMDIGTQGEVNGIIFSMKSRKGGTYITFDNSEKVHFYPCRNYLYKKPFMFDFLQIGDQITKREGNDTLFVYRNGQEYYFVLGEIVNRK